jgi:hypothetical protein
MSDTTDKLTTAEKLEQYGLDVILARVANCDFLADIAKDCGVSRWMLTKWLNADERKDMYAGAREAQADKFADDIIQIADDGRNDTYETDDGTKTDQDVIARSRLRVDARKWLASKMAPKKYGDKLQTEHSGELVVMTDDQRRSRLAELLAKASNILPPLNSIE